VTHSLILLMIAQFLTAFADNAILFANVLQDTTFPGWYVHACPLTQSNVRFGRKTRMSERGRPFSDG
jgi:hypothetical protein